jgi:hypothetical protein
MIRFSIVGLASSLSPPAAGGSASTWFLGGTCACATLMKPMVNAPVARSTWSLSLITFAFILSLLVVVVG